MWYSILNISLSVLPAILIIGFAYLWFKPFKAVPALTHIFFFVAGMLTAIPIYFLELWTTESAIHDFKDWKSLIIYSFILIALFEEVFKYIVGLVYPYRSKRFKKPIDFIMVFGLMGLGFASLENVMYAILFDIPNTLIRIFTAIPFHLSLSIIMGYLISVAKENVLKRSFSLISALLLPVFLHGLYDMFIIQDINENLSGLSLVVLVFSLVLAFNHFKIAMRKENLADMASDTSSPHWGKVMESDVEMILDSDIMDLFNDESE